MTLNLLTGLIAVALGAAYTAMSLLLPRAPFGDPTRHIVYPAILGILMMVLGAAHAVLAAAKNPKAKPGDRLRIPEKLSRHGKEIAICVGASLVYAFVFEPLGYVLATILYLGTVLFVINGKDKVVRTVVVALAFSVGIYVLFGYVLGIKLPGLPFLDI